jgi:hypothetical protein
LLRSYRGVDANLLARQGRLDAPFKPVVGLRGPPALHPPSRYPIVPDIEGAFEKEVNFLRRGCGH